MSGATHTYVRLEISPSAWAEIAQKLRDAFYDHAFHDGVIDMHGIGLAAAQPDVRTADHNGKAYQADDVDYMLTLAREAGAGLKAVRAQWFCDQAKLIQGTLARLEKLAAFK